MGFAAGRIYDGAPLQVGVIVDFAVTDLTHRVPYELCLLAVLFSPETGHMYRPIGVYHGVEEPAIPISPEVQQINGIDPASLKGARFDDERVRRIVASADVLISHNASFDAGVYVARFGLPRKPWVCSVEQIPWRMYGYPNASLVSLSGTKTNTPVHNALALLDILASRALFRFLTPEEEGYAACVTHAPYDARDQFLSRGYTWTSGGALPRGYYRIFRTKWEARASLASFDDLLRAYGSGGTRVIHVTPETRYLPLDIKKTHA